MASVTETIEAKYKKKTTAGIQSGDTVRVHQKVHEGGKERIQIFEGLVIRVNRMNSLTSNFSVRRIASGIGVEKTFLFHSPSILKVEVVRRSKVRRNYLTYMRARAGKRARLTGVDFDKDAINAAQDKAAEDEEERIHEEQVKDYDPEAAKAEKEAEKAEAEAARTAEESVESQKTEADKIEEKPKEKPSAKAPAEESNKEK
jgi:large subunit ribosomal protein L19